MTKRKTKFQSRTVKGLSSKRFKAHNSVKCANASSYYGFREPRCNDGDPCEVCSLIWANRQLLARYRELKNSRLPAVITTEDLNRRVLTAAAGVVQTVLGKSVKKINIEWNQPKDPSEDPWKSPCYIGGGK